MGFNASDTFSAFEESVYTASITGGILTLDFNSGRYARVSLTENVTGVTILNPPAPDILADMTVELTQDSTGSRTITGGYETASGAGLDISSAATSKSLVVFLTTDAGITYLGMSAGKAYS
jgi:hypothetical protein